MLQKVVLQLFALRGGIDVEKEHTGPCRLLALFAMSGRRGEDVDRAFMI
jgi:hypothetical protein